MGEDNASQAVSAALSTVGIVGAGFMGSGIAQAAAAAGLSVRVYEPDGRALERSRRRLEESGEQAVRRGRANADDIDALLGAVRYTSNVEDLHDVEIAIEAAPEDLRIKQGIFRELDELLPHAAVIASNTSSVPIAELAAHTKRPDRVLGLHFFSPVPVMRLVEVVVGLDTSRDAVSAAEAFAHALGKTAIRTKDRAGFVVNMLLVPYLMAAVRMYEQGFASREDIDVGMQLGCGHPMGPLTLCDFIGLDVLQAVCESLVGEFNSPEYAAPPLLKRMVASGRLGRKSGGGFYEYAQELAAVGASL
ncbi:3-hydroxybutyryl-CoA dehydrogenase [Conexibacter sp. S30A1]|uniref:3-hydroxybutyryl-CoA dehydrogenase n=1 Tax=Conexibacter sp. S30A1 TaxID=2937800 RepID=UPI00200E80FA|nr:3-hydroxybutyryl-CoA dehydrogenase [Conexibacter sp. S30A1]